MFDNIYIYSSSPVKYYILSPVTGIPVLKHHGKILKQTLNPLSPKIDFYVDLLICATSWVSNHKFMLLS